MLVSVSLLCIDSRIPQNPWVLDFPSQKRNYALDFVLSRITFYSLCEEQLALWAYHVSSDPTDTWHHFCLIFNICLCDQVTAPLQNQKANLCFIDPKVCSLFIKLCSFLCLFVFESAVLPKAELMLLVPSSYTRSSNCGMCWRSLALICFPLLTKEIDLCRFRVPCGSPNGWFLWGK